MKIDFFNTNCEESPRISNRFGICDEQKGAKAFTDISDETLWIATVINPEGLKISFTAIDNCIIVQKDGTNDQESTCDGMLTFRDSLYLVELKNQGTGGWIPKAISQLENTIQILWKNHDLNTIRYKKAYACNKRHPNFKVIDVEKRKEFFNRTNGFRLDVQAELRIK